jgi:hypothetical protein
MVLTFCYLCQVAPFVKKDHFHLRATDDTFVMVIECNDKTNEDEAKQFLAGLGADQISTQFKETRWWLGTYGSNKRPFERVETVA